jgi:hypothetical protein
MVDNVAKTGVPQQPSALDPNVVGNMDFWSQLDKLRLLRDFVVRETIKSPLPEPANIALGRLNSIVYGEKGRQPDDPEWDELSAKLQYFYGLLGDAERRKFNFALAAPMLKATPTVLVFFSIMFLIIPIVAPTVSWVSFGAFLGWIVTVGALGSIAFILVNALGIQVDPTVDVTDRDSTMFRVLLGALFSVVLTLPFGYQSFEHFHSQILRPENPPIDPKEAALILLPFLFGFSTSLVLTVLNRLVEGVQTFFGVSAKKP